MPSINKVQLIGNITANTDLRMTKNGKKVANFTIATNERWKNEDGQIIDNANFHKLVAWNGLASYASKVCNKGRLMYVEGKLVNKDYETTKGEKKFITEIIVNGLKPLEYEKKTTSESESEDLPTENVEIEVIDEGELEKA